MDPRIAVFTLTRDRLPYTAHCFASLRERAGLDFDHYVYDNGSSDGTAVWLKQNKSMFKETLFGNKNIGIGCAANILLGKISRQPYDFVVKLDNDCEVVSENVLAVLAEGFREIGWGILSPRVEGIDSQKQCKRFRQVRFGGKWTIGVTNHVGGLFLMAPAIVYRRFRFPKNLPPARGYDSSVCRWIVRRHGTVGYVEELLVNHFDTTDGQKERFPEYWRRKVGENPGVRGDLGDSDAKT